ncbi:MAG: DNA translocase FtsK [Candidatus Pacebacteria bacterium]|nr:DNA translocase FtsK [Candidatus Paceibacterota bacterium]
MARKKESTPMFGERTKRWILLSILSFITLVFFLGSIQSSGMLGVYAHDFAVWLFGFGFLIIPLSLTGIIIGIIKKESFSDHIHAVWKGVIALISLLTFIHILSPDMTHGGIIGSFVGNTFITLMGSVIAGIVSVTGAGVGLLLLLDRSVHDMSWFTKLQEILVRPIPLFGKNKDTDEDVAEDFETEEDDEEEINPKPIKTTDGIIPPAIKKAMMKISDDEEIDIPTPKPLVRLSPFTPPPLDLLENDKGKPSVGDIKANGNMIQRTLANFGINVEMDEISIGPTVTRYSLKPAEGVKLSRIIGLQNDLALALAAHPIRIEAPIPGKSLVGIEIPNKTKAMVGLGTLFADAQFTGSDKPLLLALGKGVSGRAHYANLAKMPHLLLAGATGSGKSVTIHALVTSLLYRNAPEDLRFIMIDPKRVELTLYNSIPHLLTPVITEAKKSILSLKWAAKEMDRRYNILENEKVRDIQSYHNTIVRPAYEKAQKKGQTEDDVELPERMPYIVVIIDELADLMQAYPRELESNIVRLAQMSRAVGIHLILSTQRPSVNVITGLIKANVPSRIALQVSSQIDSRTILDASGAEKLLGAGDMLYQTGDMSKPERAQSAFISEDEVKRVVKHLARAYADMPPDESIIFPDTMADDKSISSMSLEDGDDDDDLYEEAKQVVIDAKKASTSYLQRKLKIGYARAARLMDILEERGVVGPADGAKPREVLVGQSDSFSDSPDDTGEDDEEDKGGF